MKKNMIFSGAMSWMTALLLCTACSSDDVTTDKATAAVPEGKVIHYTATVGEGDETRATLNSSKKYEFQTDDKLVITGTDISGELTLKAGDEGKSSNATFEGDLTYTGGGTPADNLELKAVLVSTNNAMTTLTYDEATYPTTAVASTLAEAVQKYSHFTATSTYAAKDFKVSQQTSFLNFTVTFTDGTAANTDFDITIKNGGSTVRTGSVKTAEVDSKVVAQFVAAMPKGTTMSSATVQLGSKDAISFGGTKILVANKIYNIKKTIEASITPMANATTSDIGKVICSEGHIHTNVSDVACGGTPQAMIAYVGTASSCSHGLAIALADASTSCTWNNAASTVSSWAGSHSVSGGTWRLPSGDDWMYMFQACGGSTRTTTWTDGMSYSYGNFRTKLQALNSSYDVQSSAYWSSMEYDSDFAWGYYFYSSKFDWDIRDNDYYVRAVLAF